MRHQPNAILSEADGLYQLSALSALRIMLPRFWDQNSRNGPFVFSFNDLHQSNIFVDEDWNVTSIIDLEFACVQPIQMTCIPTWLKWPRCRSARRSRSGRLLTALSPLCRDSRSRGEISPSVTHVQSSTARGLEDRQDLVCQRLGQLECLSCYRRTALAPQIFRKVRLGDRWTGTGTTVG